MRLFKNLSNDMVEHGSISEELVCSYFIECLLYNCRDLCFRSSLSETVDCIVIELLQSYLSGKWTAFWCLNEQLPLFGGLPEQWSGENATEFWTALVRHCEACRA